MKDQIKGYILIGSIVGAAVITFNGVNSLLNNIYKPDAYFSEQKAKRIKTWHTVVAGFCALNNTVAIANGIGRIMYRD